MDASETPMDGHERGARTGVDPIENDSAETDPDWHRRRWTTIVLERDGGGWLATQTGVDVVGRGETAADAAASYCRRIAKTDERGGLDG